MSAILNLVGGVPVDRGRVDGQQTSWSPSKGADGAPIPGLMGVPILTVIFAGLAGAIFWNLVTWLFGLPSSSSHALFGGLIGSAVAALGFGGVKWDGMLSSIVLPALAAPVVAG